MNKYIISIEVAEGEVGRILEELHAAQETIYNCYSKLEKLGAVKIKEADSDN